MTLRKYCDSPPTTLNFLKPSPLKDALPPTLHPEGLSNTRQEYFYDEICQFCEDEYKIIACPHNGLHEKGELPALYQILTYASQQNAKGPVATVSTLDTLKPRKVLLHAHNLHHNTSQYCSSYACTHMEFVNNTTTFKVTVSTI